MSQFPCDWCGSIFSTKSNLVNHQKKAIYCLEIQTKKTRVEIEQEIKQLDCPNCTMSFSHKGNLDRHIKNCSIKCEGKLNQYETLLKSYQEQAMEMVKLKTQLEDRDKQITELKEQVKTFIVAQERLNLAAVSKSTTTKTVNKNTLVQSFTPITEANMREQLPHLTIEHIKQGAQGYAQYAMEYNFKDKIAVTDMSRKKLAWKDIDGQIIYDIEGSQLSEKFFRVIKERNSKLIGELILELGNRNFDAQKRNDQVEIDAIEELTDKLCDFRKHVTLGASGKDNELKDAFVKCLCTLSAKI